MRGHWRLPARKEGAPILTWIEPYERNADQEGAVVERRYQFPEDKGE